MRKVIGVVAGMILANLVVFGWEALLQQLAFGRGFDLTLVNQAGAGDPFPLTAKLWVAFGWALGAGVGGFAAFAIARWDYAGWIVAGLVAATGIANFMLVPYPLWLRLCAVADPFIGALVAFGLYRRWRAARLRLRR